MEPTMRLTTLIPLIFCATPLFAQTDVEADLMPQVSHDLALTCLAYWVSDLEANGPGANIEVTAKEMVFFSRLIAQKATADEAAAFDTRFAEQLDFYRKTQAAMDNPATREEADMELTGSGKMCWFEILQAEGGPYEGQ
jgi:hypothetical protein